MANPTGLDDSNDTDVGPWARIAPLLAKQQPSESIPAPAGDRRWVQPDPYSTRDDASMVGQILGGRYRLERLSGLCGMGTLYLASDLQAGEVPLSITLLRPEFRSFSEALTLLRVEVRVTRMLRHPQIARLYSLNSERLGVYLVTECLEGRTLEAELESTGQGLPLSAARPLIDDLCTALAYAHDLDVMHGDLNPANVFITPEGRAKLLDFGLARAAGTRNGRFDVRRVGGLAMAYASAEILEGRVPEPRDDVYSLACTLYTALAGAHPFESRSALEARRLALKMTPLAVLSPAQNTALAQALAFDGARRTSSVAALRDDLGWAVAPDAPAAVPAQAPALAKAPGPPIKSQPTARLSVPSIEATPRAPRTSRTSRTQRPPRSPRAQPSRTSRRYVLAAAGALLLVAVGIGIALVYNGRGVSVVTRSPPAMNPAPAAAPPPAPPAPPPAAALAANSVAAAPPAAGPIASGPMTNSAAVAERKPVPAAQAGAALAVLRPLPKAAAAMADSNNCPYPREAVAQGLTGTVWLSVYVTADGKPTDAKLDKTSGADVLDQAAIRCVEQFGRFPAPPAGPASSGYRGRVRFKWSFGS
jgi:TonB family protein